VAGSAFCFFHNPETAAKRKTAQSAGGQGRQITVLPPSAPEAKLEKSQDAVRLLADTINQVRRGEIDPKVANAVGYLTGLLLKALHEAETERRVSALEAAVGQGSGAQSTHVEEDEDEEWRIPPVKRNGNHNKATG
jgi:hypothetical protein